MTLSMYGDALDQFLQQYYAKRPVNATFTGVHEHDTQLPDWSLDGLRALEQQLRKFLIEFNDAHPIAVSADQMRRDPNVLDAVLARAFVEIQRAENTSSHGVRGNPSLWTGEAIFSIVSLMIRPFAPLESRIKSAIARMRGIPAFLEAARETMKGHAIPSAWTDKALRECRGADVLLTRGVESWIVSGNVPSPLSEELRRAAQDLRASFADLAEWLRAQPEAPESAMACGSLMYDLLLSLGHFETRSRTQLLDIARVALHDAQQQLRDMLALTVGSWESAQHQLAELHPEPHDYLSAFERTWSRCHEMATTVDVVTWPNWPIRYTTFPEWTTDAAPYLYYLFYRSPAPFDEYSVYDYVVPPLPSSWGDQEQHLRAWNNSVITLNHVVHHGAIGHHVQNWHAYHRATSRIGKIAAVDCASRIGMFCGGTMAEGWACYATELMDELGFLSPLERISQQHSRVRMLARAIVDIELHQGSKSFEQCVAFYMSEAQLSSEAARSEAVKNSMFPCTAIMYWLGTQGILDLREAMKEKQGAAFSRKAFHDALLAHGSIPVPLIQRLMLENVA